jgi:hypothetical protein
MFKPTMASTVSVIMTLSMGLVSCAKKPGYDELTKDKNIVTIASAIDTDSEYLYVPMSLGAPREVVSAYAYFQGQEKIVKLKMMEEGLVAYEVDSDKRFQDNDLNETLVFTLPGTYHSYRCSENSLGECTNREEENNDIEWERKEHFIPDFANIDTHSLNVDSWAVGGDCINKTGSRVISKEMVPGRINIHIENKYEVSQSSSCVRKYMNLKELGQSSFKAQFHFSLIRLKDVASANYESVEYSNEDKVNFGFFYQENSELDPHFTNTHDYEKSKRIMNRWNPKRESIVYHLSKTFDKPENIELKKATYKAISSMNNGLAKANAKFRIKLEEPKEDINIGDLRYNMINLIDEPLANGLLGYGPIVTNPRTGEIVKTHTNMYSGVIKSALRMYWTKMVNLTNKQARKKAQETDTTAPSAVENHSLAHNSHAHSSHGHANSILKTLPKVIKEPEHHKILSDFKKAKADKNLEWRKLNERASKRSAHISQEHALSIEKYKKGVDTLEKYLELQKERLAIFAESNAYSVEFFNASKTIKAIFPEILEIENIFKAGTKLLKSWDELSNSQKTKIEKIMVPFVYSSTLVHEIGHNLGLRHNFAGSYDKANWYTDQEALDHGFDYIPESSSMMDYVSSNFGELNVLGKYDVAALRFGYAREVETVNGDFVKINKGLDELKSLRKELISKIRNNKEDEDLVSKLSKDLEKVSPKNYTYCTDENAGVTLFCNRFDEGTNMVEIVQSIISSYEDSYQTMNFRNGRTSFSTGKNMARYMFYRHSQFERVRAVFEEWEKDKARYGEYIASHGCPQSVLDRNNDYLNELCKDIKDRIDASVMAGNFFLNILKTPHHTCAVKKKGSDDEELTVRLLFLQDIYEENRLSFDQVPRSCFNPVVKEILENDDIPAEVVAEAGKYLNGINDYKPGFEGSYDRAVLGIWVDKALAIKSLVQRYSTEVSSGGLDNFYSHPKIGPHLTNFITHLITGEPLNAPVLFKDKSGKQNLAIEYSIDQRYIINSNDLPFPWLRDYLSMDSASEVSLRRILLRNAKKFDLILGSSTYDLARNSVNYYTIKKLSSAYRIEDTNIVTTRIGDSIYGAGSSNVIAYNMIKAINNFDDLSNIEAEKIKVVIDSRTGLPEEFNDTMKLAGNSFNTQSLQHLIDIKKVNPNLPDDHWDSATTNDEYKEIIKKVWKLSLDEMQQVFDFLKNRDQAPEGSDEVTQKLYTMPVSMLSDYISGRLEQKIDNFKIIIKDLPSSVEPFMFD